MAATEINSDQMPKQSGRPYDDVIGEYLEGWQKLGFELHTCVGDEHWAPCMDHPLASVAEVMELGRFDLVDVIMQRP